MVYLIHFDTPYAHAQHYLGFCESEESPLERLKQHLSGHGSKLLRAVNSAGIGYEIVRTWPNYTRSQERQLKNRKESPRLCPVCNKNISHLYNPIRITKQ